jgi:hypothetical protein
VSFVFGCDGARVCHETELGRNALASNNVESKMGVLGSLAQRSEVRTVEDIHQLLLIDVEPLGRW